MWRSPNIQMSLIEFLLLDTMIRNGDVELKAREEEIRFLRMEVG